MKGIRAALNLELALIVAMLCMACIGALTFLGVGIASALENSATQVGSYTSPGNTDSGGPGVPNVIPIEEPPGSGRFPIGPISGTPPFTIIEITDPNSPVVIGETPDVFVITDPTVGAHRYTIVDGGGKRLVQPITITIVPTITITGGDAGFFISDGHGTIVGYSTAGPGRNETVPAVINGVPTKAIAAGNGTSLPGFSKLTGTLSMPASITSIGGWAFYNCGLTGTLTLPANLKDIGPCAFYFCSGITGNLSIPNGMTGIGDTAFAECRGITSLSLPNGLTSIGVSSFDTCTGLRTLTLPASITDIGRMAFARCNGLTGTLTLLPTTMVSGWGAFYDCTNLTVSIPEGSDPRWTVDYLGCAVSTY